MAYVEWLRVRGCLKWTGIVLGALLLIVVVIRIAAIGVEHNIYGQLDQLKADPGSKVSEVVLPDGTRRTTIYDPVKQQRVVMDDRGWNGKHIVVDDWSPNAKEDLTKHWGPKAVDFTLEPDAHGRGERIDVTTDGPTGLFTYLIVGLVLAMIVATILGSPFAREGDGHLEVALTKPIARELLAVQTMLTDWAGLIAAFIAGTVFAIIVHALFDQPHITFGQRDLIALGAGVVGPLAWYAMLTAATASLKRGYGAILGFAWPVAAIVVGLSLVDPGGSPLLAAVHDVAWVLSWIDPLRYLHFGSDPTTGGVYMTGGEQVAILAMLALAYAIVAVLQWRRVEA